MSYLLEYLDLELNRDCDYVIISEDEMHEYDFSNLDERIIKQRVVRGGKRKFKFQTSKPGFKVIINNQGVPKEVLISPKEKIARQISQKRAAKLRKIKQDPAQAKRASSIKRKEIITKTSSEKKADVLLQKKRNKEREDRDRQDRVRGSGEFKPQTNDESYNSFSKVYYEI